MAISCFLEILVPGVQNRPDSKLHQIRNLDPWKLSYKLEPDIAIIPGCRSCARVISMRYVPVQSVCPADPPTLSCENPTCRQSINRSFRVPDIKQRKLQSRGVKT